MTSKIKENGRGGIEVEGVILLMDFNAFCDLEQDMGVPLSEMGEHFASGKFSAATMRRIFYVAMRRKTPDATEQDAGDLITKLGLAGATGIIPRLFAQAGLGGMDAEDDQADDDVGQPVGNA